MGGKSKSSSNTTNNNTSGQVGIDGDNLGVALSGIANSTVNVTATDHGAVNAAFDMGGEMIAGMTQVSNNSLLLADSTVERGLNFADSTLDRSFDFAGELVKSSNQFAGKALETNAEFAGSMLNEFSASNSENMQMLAGLSGSQAAQNSENLKAVMDLAKHKQDGGASVQSKQQLIAFVAVFLIAGFVLVRGN
ncbi:chemotaxis protein [Vibrio metschnikovii]|uniref:chemotaxis protein n=1 Tax=Vibrio metschnikovii TaxID=28172 RepID=UPI001C306157|nr:chemotaxis protein [Vibrio metschnikovii]